MGKKSFEISFLLYKIGRKRNIQIDHYFYLYYWLNSKLNYIQHSNVAI